MKSELFHIVRRPMVTEKSTLLKEKRSQYVFKVDRTANKHTIREAIEKCFNVKVADVRALINSGKSKRIGRFMGRESSWKKAIVALKPGYKIEYYEGV